MADRTGHVKRLFVAVDIDDRTRAQVAELTVHLPSTLLRAAPSNVEGLKADATASAGGVPRMTWVRPDRMHLTLEFFGEADAAVERQVLGSLAHPFPLAPFDLAFNGLGFFPLRGAPRVLWLGISAGLAELRQLHGLLQQRLGARGSARDSFHPHLTLARFRDRVGRRGIAELAKIGASAGPCRIDRVTLYESHLSPNGPAYSTLAQAALVP